MNKKQPTHKEEAHKTLKGERKALLICIIIMAIYVLAASFLTGGSLAFYTLGHAFLVIILIPALIYKPPMVVLRISLVVGVIGAISALALVVAYLPYYSYYLNHLQ